MCFNLDRRTLLKNAIYGGVSVASIALGGNAQSSLAKNKPQIVIVGSGLSGMCAAHELMKNGYDVTLLEARNRPGGRIETQRNALLPNAYVETGARIVSNTHFHVINYVHEFGLSLRSIANSAGQDVYYINDRRVLSERGRGDDWPVSLSSSERRFISYFGIYSFIHRSLQPVLDRANFSDFTDAVPQRLRSLDNISLYQLLRQRRVSPGAISLLRRGALDSIGDGVESYSALSALRHHFLHKNVRELYTIQGGTDLLTNAFASRLTGKIAYGAKVVKIENNSQNVIVVFNHGGTDRELVADKLICTIPFSVLRDSNILSGVSMQKQNAVQALKYTSVTRIFLKFQERFWETSQLSGWGVTDLPIMFCNDVTNNRSERSGVLEVFISGPSARRFQNMDENTRLREILKNMEILFPGAIQNFEVGFCKIWDEDPWARGAYSWFKPGQMNSLLPHIARPEGHIHFAGEHTSQWPGFMQGALASGRRAATEVHNAISL